MRWEKKHKQFQIGKYEITTTRPRTISSGILGLSRMGFHMVVFVSLRNEDCSYASGIPGELASTR